jgi:translation initiation factor IF-3
VSYPHPPRGFSNAPQHRLNGKIRAREVRLIGPDGQQLGVTSLTEAMRLAQNHGVDLVEIVPEALPPVCRLVNYGKFRYEESKKQKKTGDATRNQLKEIQLRPGIAEHDFATKLTHAREFLDEGMQVKVALRFRGRELRHPEFGMQLVTRFVAELAAYGRADAPPKRVERNIHAMLRPLPQQQRGKTSAAKPSAPTVPSPAPPAPAAPPAEPFTPPAP